MNGHRPSTFQIIASKFIKRVLGPRFTSNSKDGSARYPCSQHRRLKSGAVSATVTPGSHNDERSARNSYKPPMDGMAVEPFTPDKYSQDSSPNSYRASGVSDGEASTSCTSASPDGQPSLTRTISAAAVRNHTDASSPPKTIVRAKNSDDVNLSDVGGNTAVGQDDNVTSYSNDMPGVPDLSALSRDEDEDDVPLVVLREQARRQSRAEQRPGPSIDKPTAAGSMSPEIVITHSDGAQYAYEGANSEADMTFTSDPTDGNSISKRSQRRIAQSSTPSVIGAASSSTSLQTFTTGSASPGPSFDCVPISSTSISSSPVPSSSRPSPKIIVPRHSSRRISMDRDGNLSSLRFSPTIVSRQPMPLKLPTLPTLTPPEGTNNQNTDKQRKRDRRARYRSMPALPRSGLGRGVGGHEEEDDADEDEDDTIEEEEEEGEDDILNGEEEGRALSRIDDSDASSAGSGSSVRNLSRRSSYDTGSGEARSQLRQEPIQECHHRGYLGSFLPQVDTSRLDLSFLDKPPTPLLETKRKGKARDTESATPTGRLQSSVTAGASSSTLVSNKRSTIYQKKPLPSLHGRGSMTPLHTPKPGYAGLKTLPLPPLADAERPGMYKHASQSMIDVSLKANEENPPLAASDGDSEMNKNSGGLAEPAEGKGKEKRLSRVPLAEEAPLPKILRRRSSMPSYYGLSSPPPPYPTFAPFPHRAVIQPREDEGAERLPAYSNSIYLKAILPRKMEFSQPGIQAKDRKWRRVICVLEGTMFRVYRCPPRVAGVSAFEGWWERRVGVGDVSSSASTQTATTLIHGPSIRSAARSDPQRPQDQDKEEQRDQSSATATITPKMEPKRSRLTVPFLKSVRTHIRSRSEGSQEMRQGSLNSTRASLSSRTTSPVQEVASPQSSMRSSTRTGNGTQHAVSRSSTREEVPEPEPADLIKTYSLQRAECGLGIDYVKRKNVIRVKMDGEQFLVQAKEAMEVVGWIEGIQTGTNVALDLDERVMPRGPLFPRRRRRRRVVV